MKIAARAPDLRSRIRFDKPSDQEHPAGGKRRGWVAQGIRWAQIIQQRGGEGVQAQRLAGTQPAIIIVRFDSLTVQIDPSWRAVHISDGEVVRGYALKTAVDMEGGRQYITMQAVSGDADADYDVETYFNLDFADETNSGYVALFEDV